MKLTVTEGRRLAIKPWIMTISKRVSWWWFLCLSLNSFYSAVGHRKNTYLGNRGKKSSILPTSSCQDLVGTLFCDGTVSEDGDVVCCSDSRQAMSDDKNSPPDREQLECLLYCLQVYDFSAFIVSCGQLSQYLLGRANIVHSKRLQ